MGTIHRHQTQSPLVAEQSPLELRQLLAGRDFARRDRVAREMVNFVYTVGDRTTREVLLVDPAYAPLELLELFARDDLRPVGVMLTHYHPDHAGGDLFGTSIPGVTELLEKLDVPIHVQKSELEWLARSTGLDQSAFLGHDDGDVIEVGSLECTLMHTPGHTPGSQCLLVEGNLITGDTLFIEGCGRTDLPGGDAEALYESITKIGRLTDDIVVLPGHDYSSIPCADLASLKRVNPVLLPYERTRWLSAFTSG